MTDPKRDTIDDLLRATAHVLSWDNPSDRDRVLTAIKKERGMKTPNPYRVLKAAIALWAVAVVVALCLMMVFGETLG